MKLLIERSTLDNIGYAIREKGGANDLIPVPELANSILNIPTGGGSDKPVYEITGSCQELFKGATANNFDPARYIIENFSPSEISFTDITAIANMFYNSKATFIPAWEVNIKENSVPMTTYMFYSCTNLTEVNLKLKGTINLGYNTFQYAWLIKHISDDTFKDVEFSGGTGTYRQSTFDGCQALRAVPKYFFEKLPRVSTQTNSNYHIYNNFFQACKCIDEIIDFPVITTVPSGALTNTFAHCSRLKRLTFEMNEDGTPIIWDTTGLVLNLSNYVGYVNYTNHIITAGISADKSITNDNSYQLLKDDPDCFTSYYQYTRYNHDSAVETINSLPDCSAYQASNGGTNTITFKGEAGISTDGGAINTLTEAEIAVATSRGWTVSFV